MPYLNSAYQNYPETPVPFKGAKNCWPVLLIKNWHTDYVASGLLNSVAIFKHVNITY